MCDNEIRSVASCISQMCVVLTHTSVLEYLFDYFKQTFHRRDDWQPPPVLNCVFLDWILVGNLRNDFIAPNEYCFTQNERAVLTADTSRVSLWSLWRKLALATPHAFWIYRVWFVYSDYNNTWMFKRRKTTSEMKDEQWAPLWCLPFHPLIPKLFHLTFSFPLNCVASWPEVQAISACAECIFFFPLPSHFRKAPAVDLWEKWPLSFFSGLNSNIACVREWKTRLKNMQQEANW